MSKEVIAGPGHTHLMTEDVKTCGFRILAAAIAFPLPKGMGGERDSG